MSASDNGRPATAMRADERAMKLMAYADGELYAEGREEELAEVEKWLAEDADATRFANDVAKLGDFVKAGHPKRDFDIADAVMAHLDEKVGEKSEAKPAAKVVPFEPKKRNTVGWVVAGLALAASVFFVTRSKHDDEAPLARTTSPLVQPQHAAAAVTGSVDVESAGNSVSVIYVPDEKNVGSTTTVVWVDESGGK